MARRKGLRDRFKWLWAIVSPTTHLWVRPRCRRGRWAPPPSPVRFAGQLQDTNRFGVSRTAAGTVAFYVDALEAWREAMRVEKMALLGHSLGGYIATCYAEKYPDRIDNLILVGCAGIPPTPEGWDDRPRSALMRLLRLLWGWGVSPLSIAKYGPGRTLIGWCVPCVALRSSGRCPLPPPPFKYAFCGRHPFYLSSAASGFEQVHKCQVQVSGSPPPFFKPLDRSMAQLCGWRGWRRSRLEAHRPLIVRSTHVYDGFGVRSFFFRLGLTPGSISPRWWSTSTPISWLTT